MAMHLTDVATLRASHPHTVKRYISIVPREIIFSCQIVGTPFQDIDTKGYHSFLYDNETGDYEDIKVDMTIEFGVTEGGNELGVGRIRKPATDNTIYIGETDAAKIGLADNVWVSVINHYGPHIKFPRLQGTKNGGKFTNEWEEFHDYDIAYADNNVDCPKSNIVGEAGECIKLAGWCDPAQIYRTVVLESAAWAVSANIDTITWNIEDCTFLVGDANSLEITIQIPVGFRYIELEVLSEDGDTDIMRLPFWTHDEDYPPLAYYTSGAGFKVSSDSRSAGREMTFDFFGQNDSLNLAALPKTTTVVYWEVPKFKGISVPLNYIHTFMGWITDEDTKIKKSHRSTFRMTVAGPAKWMADFQGFATILNQADVPAKWYELDIITTERCILYLIREYSTFGSLINIQPSGLANYIDKEDITKGNMWSQIDTLAKSGKMIRAGCDSIGTLWLRRYRSYQEQTERDVMPTPSVALELEDWTDDDAISFGTMKSEQLSIAKATGSDFTGGISTVVNGIAAGFVGGESGKEDTLVYQRLVPTDGQVQIRQLVGHHYKLLSNPNRLQPIRLLGNYDVVEPAWGEHITLTSDIGNMRGISIDREYIVTNVSVNHSNEKRQAPKTLTWTVEEVTLGTPGQKWIIADGGVEGEDFFPYEFDDAFQDAGSDAYWSPPSGTVAPEVPPPCESMPPLQIISTNGAIVTHLGGDIWNVEQLTPSSYNPGTTVHTFEIVIREAYGRCFDIYGSSGDGTSDYEATRCDGSFVSGVGGYGGLTRVALIRAGVYDEDMPDTLNINFFITCVNEEDIP